jgi:hypothetical protein
MRTLFAALASLALLHAAPAHADSVHDALDAYALYQNDVSVLLDLEVDSAEAINGAVARVSRHNPSRVSRGWIAYGALVAAQSPAFASGVEQRIEASSRAQVLRDMRADVTYARRHAGGAPSAIRLILSAARADGARAAYAGGRYDTIARGETARWINSSERRGALPRASANLTPAMRARLHINALAVNPARDADAFGGRRFWDSLANREGSAPRGRGGREHRSYIDVTDRMLTLGALVVMDATGSERSHVSTLLNEPLTQQCLSMQQLQLRQCLSVSVNANERTYCLAHHGLTGPGGCFSAMAR